jgi:hypothetical protein
LARPLLFPLAMFYGYLIPWWPWNSWNNQASSVAVFW